MGKLMKGKTADLVAYQDGAVVSRTLIDKKEGTVTIFSLDKDQGISEHLTPYDAMVQVLDGKALITISGVEYEIEKDGMIIMPANEPHSLKAVERFKIVLIMIRQKVEG